MVSVTGRKDLLERLARGSLLLDGAMGTELFKAGLREGETPEGWLTSNPAAVRAVHASYDAAGSEAIYTCTFGANRVKLKRAGLADKAAELNRKAVEIARSAMKNARWLIGSMGPTGEMLEPYGELEEAAALEAFAEQARALVEAGVDAIVAETFSDPGEIAIAVKAARSAGDVAVLGTMTFEGAAKGSRTMMGTTPEKAAEAMLSAGADAVGANCGTGPADLVDVIKRMRKVFPDAKLIAKPNAGMPVSSGGRTVYPLSPDDFALQMRALRAEGASILGGCCGTTPLHVAGIRSLISEKGS
jgi:5-methyltetrahydrofolate--homocysteine methyltransferase